MVAPAIDRTGEADVLRFHTEEDETLEHILLSSFSFSDASIIEQLQLLDSDTHSRAADIMREGG